MIQKNKEIDIPEDNIFSNDKLDRKEVIEDLSKLLVSTHEPFVLGINASWGAGKTTFVKLWKAYLENELSIHSVYFSAWEDDFSKEPLIAIMGELNSYIENNFPKDKNLHKQFEELKNVSGKIIKRGLPAFIKGATAGALDFDKGVESAIGAVTESVAKELIDSYENDKAITIEFKELLHDIIEQIDSEKPLIIFIDELDRCRPLYAIELLERLKHVFGIEKLIFVLSIDKKQLSESIKSQYGDIDTGNYLRRFIDLEFKLNNLKTKNFITYLDERYKFYKVIETKGYVYDDYYYIDTLWHFSELLSLREIENIFLRLNIIARTIETAYQLRIAYSNPVDIFNIITFVLLIKEKLFTTYDGKDANELISELSRKQEASVIYARIYEYFVKNIQVKYSNHDTLLAKISFAIKKIDFTSSFGL